MKAISYRMTADSGHAPCVFDSLADLLKTNESNYKALASKLLTLSCCGQKVRQIASKDSIVIGIAGNDFGEKANGLIWAGRVGGKIEKSEYFDRYPARPDNYYSMQNGKYVQHPNPFHDDANLFSDLNPANTLLFTDFWYFGKNAIALSSEFQPLVARNWPCYVGECLAEKFMRRLKEHFPELGIYGLPFHLEELKAGQEAVSGKKYDWQVARINDSRGDEGEGSK